jgi:superfamily II DNA or RNA helicase
VAQVFAYLLSRAALDAPVAGDVRPLALAAPSTATRLSSPDRAPPLSAQLLQAAERLDASAPVGSASAAPTLRPEQAAVFRDAADYLLDVATRPDDSAAMPFGRIVLPPRTGKTVIAAHLIGRSGLSAAVIVHTKALVLQTLRELRTHAPDVPAGVFFGEQKGVVDGGVNVLTYAILQRAWERGALPAAIRRAALVFVDEAHHTMTSARGDILREAFDPRAIRLALTATPDYGPDRQLRHHFPDLIHEIDLAEALALDLLAPARVWVAEVDADASKVRFVAGDYEADTLGRLLSTAPFFRAVEMFRYLPENEAIPALVSCASRQQAHDLWRYLQTHRPKGRPAPALILGDTPGEERERALAGFERGRLDTLIQVGVLIEGWSSPRCKLLIDLAPSASRVRATQKYFRVMTRCGAAEARIYVFLPKALPTFPVLPMDLFGQLGEYECGEIIGRAGVGSRPLVPHARTPVAGVELKQRIVLSGLLERPALDTACASDVRAVLESCAELDVRSPCGPRRFRWLWFDHALFKGRGDFLLRWLGVRATNDGYWSWFLRLYPARLDQVADGLLGAGPQRERWCEDDVARVADCLEREGAGPERISAVLRLLGGSAAVLDPDPLARLTLRSEATTAAALCSRLSERHRQFLELRFGLSGEDALAFDEIAARLEVSGGRASQVVQTCLRRMRHWIRFTEVGLRGPVARALAEEEAARELQWEAARQAATGRPSTTAASPGAADNEE